MSWHTLESCSCNSSDHCKVELSKSSRRRHHSMVLNALCTLSIGGEEICKKFAFRLRFLRSRKERSAVKRKPKIINRKVEGLRTIVPGMSRIYQFNGT